MLVISTATDQKVLNEIEPGTMGVTDYLIILWVKLTSATLCCTRDPTPIPLSWSIICFFAIALTGLVKYITDAVWVLVSSLKREIGGAPGITVLAANLRRSIRLPRDRKFYLPYDTVDCQLMTSIQTDEDNSSNCAQRSYS